MIAHQVTQHLSSLQIKKACCLFLLSLFFISAPFITLGRSSEIPLEITPDERAWLDQNPDKLTLFYATNFPPVEFASQDNSFSGISADIIALVEKKLGITFNKTAEPDWGQLLSALENGSCAMAPAIVETSDRERFAYFTPAYTSIPVVIITRTSTKGRLSLDDLGDKPVAVVSGYVTEKHLQDPAQGNFNLVPMHSPLEALQALALGRVEAYVESLAVAAYYIEKTAIPNLRIAGRTDLVFKLSIGISRQYPKLHNAVQKALASIPEKKLAEINRSWISLTLDQGLDSETKKIYTLVALFLGLVILGLAVISFVLKHRLDEKISSLAKSEKRFRAIFDNAPYAIVVNNLENGRYIDANQSFLDRRGMTREELAGLKTSDVATTLEDEAALIRSLLKEKGSLKNMEATSRHRNGNLRHVIFSSVLLELEGEQQILSMTVDVTDRVKAQNALKNSEKRFRSLFMMSPTPLLEISATGKIIQVNLEFKRIFGYDNKEIPTIQDLWEQAYSSLPKKTYSPPLDKKILNRIMAGRMESETLEVSLICKDETIRTFIMGSTSIENNILINFFDITQRKELEDRLLQAQKMEALGTLAGGIAHDFNNILSAILGFTELAKGRIKEDKKTLAHIDKALKAGIRARELVSHILSFSRRADIKKEIIRLTPVIMECIKFIRASIPSNITISHHLDSPCDTVEADPTQLHQVLMNFFTNASHAMKEKGGNLDIRLDSLDVQPKDFPGEKKLTPGPYHLLTIEDTGTGIPKSIINRIYEPFFTTKPQGEGTGMGLSTAYGIIKELGGTIIADSEPGRGTIFYILLPKRDETPQPSAKQETLSIEKGKGRILVVDDEPAIVDWLQQLLSGMGYGVTSFTSSKIALKTFKLAPDSFDLAITDLSMPQMAGLELSNHLISIKPGLPIILCTGFSHGLTREEIKENGISEMVLKPMIAKEVLQAVTRALVKKTANKKR